MKIVVMCENATQFYNYVHAVLQDVSKLTMQTIEYSFSNVLVHTDDLEFIYCRNSDTLRGRSFDKDDRIVKIGSWYNIPEETQKDIVTRFMARTTKRKVPRGAWSINIKGGCKE